MTFNDAESEKSFEEHFHEASKSNIVAVMVILVVWNIDHVVGLLHQSQNWYVYCLEAAIFIIHIFRVAFLRAGRCHRYMFMFAGSVAVVCQLMLSYDATAEDSLLLPNVMLEVLALQYFGLLFQVDIATQICL